MLLELAAVTASCLIMALYLTAYICNAGLPASLSATFYRTERKWLFPLTIATSGLLAMVPLLNHTPDRYRFVAFFIVAATLFVASAPAFRDEFTGRVHATAAAILGLSTLAWLILTIGWPWLALTGLCIALLDHPHFLLWLELGLLTNLYSALTATLLT